MKTSVHIALEYILANHRVTKGNVSYFKKEEYSNLLWFYDSNLGELVMDVDTGESLAATLYLYDVNPI